jgi:hypothetical protein
LAVDLGLRPRTCSDRNNTFLIDRHIESVGHLDLLPTLDHSDAGILRFIVRQAGVVDATANPGSLDADGDGEMRCAYAEQSKETEDLITITENKTWLSPVEQTVTHFGSHLIVSVDRVSTKISNRHAWARTLVA